MDANRIFDVVDPESLEIVQRSNRLFGRPRTVRVQTDRAGATHGLAKRRHALRVLAEAAHTQLQLEGAIAIGPSFFGCTPKPLRYSHPPPGH